MIDRHLPAWHSPPSVAAVVAGGVGAFFARDVAAVMPHIIAHDRDTPLNTTQRWRDAARMSCSPRHG